ncbi:MAG: hypothetical protein KC656_37480, partial [Myxococcales bacterium]|nr:hypothetical protein [Myxococcales bacterium]
MVTFTPDACAPEMLDLTPTATLRPALPGADEDALVAMSVALYAEDPGARNIHEADVRRTLAHLAAHPDRGLALVVTDGDEPVGYMILIAFWSNELGGLVAIVDE